MNFAELIGAAELGLIYGLVALGVYLTFRILDFPDMTVDGSFPMGAGLAAVLILSGHDPWFATLCAIIAGSIAGLITACLNVYGRIMNLLASILTMTALYSINLRIMGAPNLGLLHEATIFQNVNSLLLSMGFHVSHKTSVILLTFTVISIVMLGLYWFFNTQMGLAMRATGKNKQMATAQGIKINVMVLAGLALSNSLYALSGAIYAQSQGFADITMGPGTILVGLAAVIIGEAIVRTRSITFALVSCIIGAVAYHIVRAMALNSDVLGLESSDLKLVEAVLIASAMVFSHFRHSVKQAVLSTRKQKV